jgi:hypothetical protein
LGASSGERRESKPATSRARPPRAPPSPPPSPLPPYSPHPTTNKQPAIITNTLGQQAEQALPWQAFATEVYCGPLTHHVLIELALQVAGVATAVLGAAHAEDTSSRAARGMGWPRPHGHDADASPYNLSPQEALIEPGAVSFLVLGCGLVVWVGCVWSARARARTRVSSSFLLLLPPPPAAPFFSLAPIYTHAQTNKQTHKNTHTHHQHQHTTISTTKTTTTTTQSTNKTTKQRRFAPARVYCVPANAVAVAASTAAATTTTAAATTTTTTPPSPLAGALLAVVGASMMRLVNCTPLAVVLSELEAGVLRTTAQVRHALWQAQGETGQAMPSVLGYVNSLRASMSMPAIGPGAAPLRDALCPSLPSVPTYLVAPDTAANPAAPAVGAAAIAAIAAARAAGSNNNAVVVPYLGVLTPNGQPAAGAAVFPATAPSLLHFIHLGLNMGDGSVSSSTTASAALSLGTALYEAKLHALAALVCANHTMARWLHVEARYVPMFGSSTVVCGGTVRSFIFTMRSRFPDGHANSAIGQLAGVGNHLASFTSQQAGRIR